MARLYRKEGEKVKLSLRPLLYEKDATPPVINLVESALRRTARLRVEDRHTHPHDLRVGPRPCELLRHNEALSGDDPSRPDRFRQADLDCLAHHSPLSVNELVPRPLAIKIRVEYREGDGELIFGPRKENARGPPWLLRVH